MKPSWRVYYDFRTQFEPELLKYLNALLVLEGTDPVQSLHGGLWHQGHWVEEGSEPPLDREYRNYWHAWLDLWGDRVSNGSYVSTWFPDAGDSVDWQAYFTQAQRRGAWARTLVGAVRALTRDYNITDTILYYDW